MRTINIISSKSDAHRALICNFLAKEKCKIEMKNTSEDIKATKDCISALEKGEKELYCRESGSTLRFLLPVVAALGKNVEFYSEGRLSKRPLSPLYEELKKKGCDLSPQGKVPLEIKGKLKPGIFTLPGNVSSQYISGLLMALPILEGNSEIRIEKRLESEGYVNLTLNTLKKFNILIEKKNTGFLINGRQIYKNSSTYKVEGDWSNGAFWLTLGAFLKEGIYCKGLSLKSKQGDREIVNILKSFGAEVEILEDGVLVKRKELKAIEIDVSQIPDLVPVIAVLGTMAKGTTIIKNAKRLRIKESDRLESISSVLNTLGANIKELEDGLEIQGLNYPKNKLKGGRVDSYNDHRIAMMAAISSIVCVDKVEITNSDAVNKSYPEFFDELKKLELSNNIIRR